MTDIRGITALPETSAELDTYYGDAPDGVRANMVMTLDGQGAFEGRTKAISSSADQRLLAHLRQHADAVMIGATTVVAEGYGPVRLAEEVQGDRESHGHAPLPPLVIVTARAALPATLKVFNGEGPRPIIATTERGATNATELADVAELLVVGAETIEPAAVIAALQERSLNRILCEGGPYLLSTLVEHDLVDDMCLTVSPFLAGRQPTTNQSKSHLEAPSRLALRHVLTHDDLLYLRYSRHH